MEPYNAIAHPTESNKVGNKPQRRQEKPDTISATNWRKQNGTKVIIMHCVRRDAIELEAIFFNLSNEWASQFFCFFVQINLYSSITYFGYCFDSRKKNRLVKGLFATGCNTIQ